MEWLILFFVFITLVAPVIGVGYYLFSRKNKKVSAGGKP